MSRSIIGLTANKIRTSVGTTIQKPEKGEIRMDVKKVFKLADYMEAKSADDDEKERMEKITEAEFKAIIKANERRKEKMAKERMEANRILLRPR
jgi:hypothetical protein